PMSALVRISDPRRTSRHVRKVPTSGQDKRRLGRVRVGRGRTFVMTNEPDILKRWQLLSPYLDRRQQACCAAAQSLVIGPGGCLLLAAVTGLGAQTISNRRCQI